ncbi:1-acyl-sn-glycerol-3-phosphate acyltransferase [Suttonella sp. R2A3]|uniref:lysophospholipid acyltransferase family protein n=1 Tax=Suttonella sp. R2A3 TaxID=2908648 RepID=UPI001F3D3E64|nr:lysophospholipid acyltransferase family protein [Suttonella sp. R2A3]UJF23660.1 1-acyl-sn-glycerol-3-phosphate acyltransferase [Suttonella sp. R2A3]
MAGLVLRVLLPWILRHESPGLARTMRARAIVAWVWKRFLHIMRFGGVLNYRVHGGERLGKEGQLILANHPSLLDVVFLLSLSPSSNCIVKHKLMTNPVLHKAIELCGFIPNDESMETFEQATEVLRTGQSLMIFPEGSRTGADGVIDFNRGAVSIGLHGAKVITPVVIRMRPRGLMKHQPWYYIPPTRYEYEIIVGEDIDPQTYLQNSPLPIAARLLNRELIDYFQRESQC